MARFRYFTAGQAAFQQLTDGRRLLVTGPRHGWRPTLVALRHETDDSPAVTPRSLGPVVATLAATGVPVADGVLDPILGEIVFLVELVVVLTLVGAALFGSLDLSERAFRLLRWIGNRPEPPAPEQAASTILKITERHHGRRRRPWHCEHHRNGRT